MCQGQSVCEDSMCTAPKRSCTNHSVSDCINIEDLGCSDNDVCQSGFCHYVFAQGATCREAASMGNRPNGHWCQENYQCLSRRCSWNICTEPIPTCTLLHNNDCRKDGDYSCSQ